MLRVRSRCQYSSIVWHPCRNLAGECAFNGTKVTLLDRRIVRRLDYGMSILDLERRLQVLRLNWKLWTCKDQVRFRSVRNAKGTKHTCKPHVSMLLMSWCEQFGEESQWPYGNGISWISMKIRQSVVFCSFKLQTIWASKGSNLTVWGSRRDLWRQKRAKPKGVYRGLLY